MYVCMCTADKMLSVYFLQGIPEAVYHGGGVPHLAAALLHPCLTKFPQIWVRTSPCNSNTSCASSKQRMSPDTCRKNPALLLPSPARSARRVKAGLWTATVTWNSHQHQHQYQKCLPSPASIKPPVQARPHPPAIIMHFSFCGPASSLACVDYVSGCRV